MVQIFWRNRALRALFPRLPAFAEKRLAAGVCEDWMRDPLSHPAVDAMSLSELADLPARQLRSCCRE